MFSKDFKEFLELLIKHKAEYLVVGGYAVGVHGHPRFTGDLDIWLNPTYENAINIKKAVDEFGFGASDLKIEYFTKENNVIQLGYPPLRIDLLTNIDGVNFNECFKNKIVVDIEDIPVNFISYQDLVKNKKATGRNRDLDDLENMKPS
jgi:hypothetical protein